MAKEVTPLIASETLAGLREQEILLDEGNFFRQLVNEIEKLGCTNWFLSSHTMFGKTDFSASAEISDNVGKTDMRARSELSPEDALARLLLRLCQLSSLQSI